MGNGDFGDYPYGLADYGGKLYTLNQGTDQVVELNPTTAAIVNTVSIGLNTTGEGAMAFNSVGTLFFSRSSGSIGILYSTTLNGSSNVIDSSLDPSMDGMDFAPNGTLYGIDQTNLGLYTINPANGDTTLIGPTGIPVDGVAGFAIRQDGALFAAVGRSLYSINPSTGAGTLIGVTGYDRISGLTFLEDGGGGQVPEPSTWALMLSGLAGLAFRKLRRK
ncbi:MAG: DUF4394 domain-containing protein [Acidobacteria bacterium]|nr:DUF4394 domain-containing protein [Acidobacteriota bacterium]